MRHAGRANWVGHDDILERGPARVSFGRRASSSQVGEPPDETIAINDRAAGRYLQAVLQITHDMSARDRAPAEGKPHFVGTQSAVGATVMGHFCVPSAHVHDCGTGAGYRGPSESRAIPLAIEFGGPRLPGNGSAKAAGGVSAQVGDDPSTPQRMRIEGNRSSFARICTERRDRRRPASLRGRAEALRRACRAATMVNVRASKAAQKSWSRLLSALRATTRRGRVPCGRLPTASRASAGSMP
jgi:hypothetical protein